MNKRQHKKLHRSKFGYKHYGWHKAFFTYYDEKECVHDAYYCLFHTGEKIKLKNVIKFEKCMMTMGIRGVWDIRTDIHKVPHASVTLTKEDVKNKNYPTELTEIIELCFESLDWD